MVTRTKTTAVIEYVDGGSDTALRGPAEPTGAASGEHAPDLRGTDPDQSIGVERPTPTDDRRSERRSHANAWLVEGGYPCDISLVDERSKLSAGTGRRDDRREMGS